MLEWLGPLLLIASIAAAMASLLLTSPLAKLAVTIAAAVAAVLAPIGATTAVQYAYSLTGPLSAASLMLLGVGLLHLLWPRKIVPSSFGCPLLSAMILTLALPLYIFELTGLGPDLYRWGYGGWQLPAVLGLMLLVALWRRAPVVAVWLLLGGVLSLASAYDSLNLFDYMVDPIAVVLALAMLWHRAMARLRSSRRVRGTLTS